MLFAMVLFFLMLLWMGAVWTIQSHVVIGVRYDAWEQRDAQRANPFEMQDIGQGIVSSSGERPIHVSHVVDRLIIPRASHTVYAGTWQHPHFDLNQSPNWPLYPTLMRKAAGQKLDELNRVTDRLAELPSMRGDAVRDKVNGTIASLNPLNGQLLGARDQAMSQLEERQREEKQKAKAELEARQNEVRGQIEGAERQLQDARGNLRGSKETADRLRGDLKKEEERPDKNEQTIEGLKVQIQGLDDKIRDLEQNVIPRLERAINSFRKADAELQNGLGQINGN